MKKTLKILLVALASLTAAPATTLAQDKVTIATNGAYPPFSFRDSAGEMQGFDVDLANALCDELNLECIVTPQEWTGLIPSLLANKFDIIIASMSITPERAEKVNFSDPYYNTPSRFVAPKDTKYSISKEGLQGAVIGVERATTHSNYLEARFGEVAELRYYDSQENINLDLAAGRLDLALAGTLAWHGSFFNNEELSKGFDYIGPEVADPTFYGKGVGMAFRKKDTELLAKFNKALATLLENGSYQRINAKYFPFSIYNANPALSKAVVADEDQ